MEHLSKKIAQITEKDEMNGPSFGNDDIHLKNLFLCERNNESNFGSRYKNKNFNPKYNSTQSLNLLAGSHKFRVIEIEIYSIPN